MEHRYRIKVEDLDEGKTICDTEVDVIFLVTSHRLDVANVMGLYKCPKHQYLAALNALNNLTISLNDKLSRADTKILKGMDKHVHNIPTTLGRKVGVDNDGTR